MSPVATVPHEGPKLPPKYASLEIDHAGWLRGYLAVIMPAHESWYYPTLDTPDSEPVGVVWHYTATDWGTARSMAKRRMKQRKPEQRASSWHVTIGHDGQIWQLVPLISGAWHCRGKHNGISINKSLIGIELEGHGKEFPKAQRDAAYRFIQAMVDDYGVAISELSHGHVDFDPRRRSDPGKLWSEEILPGILEEVALRT